MPVWTEVQAGDMQREQENAYMFRRCASKDDWAMLCTQIGNPGPEIEGFKFEAYARATSGVEYYTMSITRAEFDALTMDQVGIDKDDGATAPTEAPVCLDTPYVSQTGSTCNCTMGNWENEPTEYHYTWSLDGADAGNDSPEYFVQAGDAGKSLSCLVSAGNAIGVTDAPQTNEIIITE